MTFNLIMAYRPTGRKLETRGYNGLRQDSDGNWADDQGRVFIEGLDKPGIDLNLDFLLKNSYFKHKIKIVIDDDVYPNIDLYKKYDVEFIKVPPFVQESSDVPLSRMAIAYNAGVMSVPDDEWLFFGFISDMVCSENWDKYIVEAIEHYGENHVFVPMFTEVRYLPKLTKEDLTPELIWDQWRKEFCCHALTMPAFKRPLVIKESDFKYFVEVARSAKKGIIIEPCGLREYGYYGTMIMKAEYAKKVGVRPIYGFDTDFDNRLWSLLRFTKIIVTDSYLLHPNWPFLEGE